MATSGSDAARETSPVVCGCAVISTDCQSGPSEILVHQRDGLLVPVDDAGALAGALAGLMEDAVYRRRLGDLAAASAHRFKAPDIAQRWLDALSRIVPNAAGTNERIALTASE